MATKATELSYDEKYELVKKGATYHDGKAITLTAAEFAKMKLQAQVEILEKSNQIHLKDDLVVIVHKTNKSAYGPNQMKVVPKKQAAKLVDKAPKDWDRYKAGPSAPVGVTTTEEQLAELERLRAENAALKAAQDAGKGQDAKAPKAPAAQKDLAKTNSPAGVDNASGQDTAKSEPAKPGSDV